MHILKLKINSCSPCRLWVLTQSAYLMLVYSIHIHFVSLFWTILYLEPLVVVTWAQKGFLCCCCWFMLVSFFINGTCWTVARAFFCFFCLRAQSPHFALGLRSWELRAKWIFSSILYVTRSFPHPLCWYVLTAVSLWYDMNKVTHTHINIYKVNESVCALEVFSKLFAYSLQKFWLRSKYMPWEALTTCWFSF